MAAAFRALACLTVVMLLDVGVHAREVVQRVTAFQARAASLRQVDVSNGIQVEEAGLIADTYFYRVVARDVSCGGVSTPTLVGGVWRTELLFGFAGEPTGLWILVDPISGGVSTAGAHGFKTFASLRRVVLLNALLDGR
ncbi:MAG: hypothetical protein JWM82_3800 [Myxococcales bacterium]|jgi:hypothetical protein|nr:hypothetical protein [Myxococcales bacterium]